MTVAGEGVDDTAVAPPSRGGLRGGAVNAPAKLASFAAILALTSAAPPSRAARSTPTAAARRRRDARRRAARAARRNAQQPVRGLAVAEDGLRLVVERRRSSSRGQTERLAFRIVDDARRDGRATSTSSTRSGCT